MQQTDIFLTNSIPRSLTGQYRLNFLPVFRPLAPKPHKEHKLLSAARGGASDRPVLHDEGQSGGHQDHPVRPRRHAHVEPALGIAERPAERRVQDQLDLAVDDLVGGNRGVSLGLRRLVALAEQPA